MRRVASTSLYTFVARCEHTTFVVLLILPETFEVDGYFLIPRHFFFVAPIGINEFFCSVF